MESYRVSFAFALRIKKNKLNQPQISLLLQNKSIKVQKLEVVFICQASLQKSKQRPP
jgi:hypothetical protein